MSEPIVVAVDPDIGELVPGFLDNRRRDVERLRALVATGSFADVRLIGHSMKGAGGGYGFDRISELGAIIEQAALAAEPTTALAAVDELADYLARVVVVFDG